MAAVYGYVARRSGFRARRMLQLAKLYSLDSTTRVVDIGGFIGPWKTLSVKPRIIMVNLDGPNSEDDRSWWVIADGCHLPFRDGEFDLAHSNSVIEHVGDLERQQAFAREVARVGRRYYVQTPNYWFPVETHFLTPIVQFLPRWLQHRIARNFTVWGIVSRPTPEQCRSFANNISLLTRKKLQQMFPNARIIGEKALGLTKSWIVTDTNQRPLDVDSAPLN
jgi:hypothetical protein